jgi:hypothetical protein
LFLFLKPIVQVGVPVNDTSTGFDKGDSEVADSSVFLKSRRLQADYFSGLTWRDGKPLRKVCSGQVISDSSIDFFDVDSRSKALGDMLPSFECSLVLL